MHPQIESIFDEAENRYLKAEELSVLTGYMDSLPQRMEAYQLLRDRELDIMQPIADLLQATLPKVSTTDIERSLKHALLSLRYCAMAMLLNDETFVQERLLNWLVKKIRAYNTHTIDVVLYPLLEQKLADVLNPTQLGFLMPFLTLVKENVLSTTPVAS